MEQLTQQQKLEILSAYLPYGLNMYGASDIWTLHQLGIEEITICNGMSLQNLSFDDCLIDYSPILRHQDDMTEEENGKYKELFESDSNFIKSGISCLQYLWSIHIDTFGAIEAGFAVRKTINDKEA